jgi:hypothetical protein
MGKLERDRKLLNETATSINKLVQDLDNKESKGEVISRAEIREIANQLQAHVRDLLDISNTRQIRQSPVAAEGSDTEN